MIPQIIWIILMALSLGFHISKHGQDKKEKYNVGIIFFRLVMYNFLLYWGGFFDVFSGGK